VIQVRSISRRGFTVIETVLAASLGALVMIGVLAIFAAMDRTDAAAARRFDETAMMTRLHVVMERVWSDLLIQDESNPNGAAAQNSGGRNNAQPDFQAPDNARNGVAQQQARPRIVLDSDPSPDLKATMQNAGMGAGAPQRLEVVLAHPPVPPGYDNTTAPELQMQLTSLGAMAARGVFELRPDSATPPERLDPGEKVSPDAGSWTLWYRPMPPQPALVQPDPYALEPMKDPSAVRLATGLLRCNWSVYITLKDPTTGQSTGKRDKLPNLQAMKLQDLPAYVEMKVTTSSGLSADWMFEVGWGFGPETTDEAAQSGTTDTGGQASGATTTFGGGPGGLAGPGQNGSAGDGNGRPGRNNGGRNQGRGGRNQGGRNQGGRNPGGPRPGGGGGGRDGP
jgi:hypothetical protein